MIKNILRLMIVVTLTAAAGCGASGPLFKPALNGVNQETIVYLYRPYIFKGGGATPNIYVDNKRVVLLKNNGYTQIQLNPGPHSIAFKKADQIKYPEKKFSFDFEILKDQKEAYIRIGIPATTPDEVLQFGGDVIFTGVVAGATSVSIPRNGDFVPNSRFIIKLVPEEKALEEIINCRYIEPEIDN
jgi:hypothetical protein